jgi:hypothetical protein
MESGPKSGHSLVTHIGWSVDYRAVLVRRHRQQCEEAALYHIGQRLMLPCKVSQEHCARYSTLLIVVVQRDQSVDMIGRAVV